MTQVYNKLVRDLIPEIIRNDNFYPVVRTLDEEEYKQALADKLMEEVRELNAAGTQNERANELADVYEVLDALCRCHKISRKAVERVKRGKYMQRGGFSKRLFLESIEEADIKPLQ